MTTKFTALAVFLLCFMPAAKIEHTQASLLSTKKTKHEEAKWLTHIDQERDESFPSLSADKDQKKIKPIKLSAHTEKKEKDQPAKTTERKKHIHSLKKICCPVSFTQRLRENPIKARSP